jgi:hypothetical protein
LPNLLPAPIVTAKRGQAMDYIETLDDLHAAYGAPGQASPLKSMFQATPPHHSVIKGAHFCNLPACGALRGASDAEWPYCTPKTLR